MISVTGQNPGLLVYLFLRDYASLLLGAWVEPSSFRVGVEFRQPRITVGRQAQVDHDICLNQAASNHIHSHYGCFQVAMCALRIDHPVTPQRTNAEGKGRRSLSRDWM
jgi:hypothetical protein